MPPERVDERVVGRILRQPDGRAVQLVILASVLELLPDPLADFEVVVGSDRHIAGVEKAMDVDAKEDAVVKGLPG